MGEEEEERRVYYVAMTRAKQTLTLFQRNDNPNPYCGLLESSLNSDQLLMLSPQIEIPIPKSVLKRRYDIIGMKDVFLDYAGRMSASAPVHKHLARTRFGDSVQLKEANGKLEVFNSAGHPIATLSKDATQRWVGCLPQIESVKVIAMIERKIDDTKDPVFQKRLKSERWEVPVLEVVWSEG